MQLVLRLNMPPPGHPTPHREEKSVLIEDKVRQAIELIDSGYCSDTEWLMVNKLYKALRKRKPTPRIRNLLAMIEPVLAKFGYHEVTTED